VSFFCRALVDERPLLDLLDEERDLLDERDLFDAEFDLLEDERDLLADEPPLDLLEERPLLDLDLEPWLAISPPGGSQSGG
jgi:hypothetical protein